MGRFAGGGFVTDTVLQLKCGPMPHTEKSWPIVSNAAVPNDMGQEQAYLFEYYVPRQNSC